MALGCDSVIPPPSAASRNRLYWTRIPPWASRVLGYSPFQPSTHYSPKWNEPVKSGPKIFVMVRSLLWLLEAHPPTSIPVLDGCQSINLQIFPDESSRQTRNDCATSPCQSCKWSRRPQGFRPDLYDHHATMSWGEVYRILIISCTFILCNFNVRMPCHDFDG